MACSVIALVMSAQDSFALVRSGGIKASISSSVISKDNGCATAIIAARGDMALADALAGTECTPPNPKCADLDGTSGCTEKDKQDCTKDLPTPHTCRLVCVKDGTSTKWQYETPNSGNCP